MTEPVEQHLRLALGSPSRSPFGYPIPGEEAASLPELTLGTAPIKVPVVIERAGDNDAKLFRLIESESLKPGTKVLVVSREEARGTVNLRIGRRHRVLLVTEMTRPMRDGVLSGRVVAWN